MPRRAGTDFLAPALLGLDDDRQLELPEDSQSHIVGAKVEQLDVVALRVPGTASHAPRYHDRVPHLAMKHEKPLHPGRVPRTGRWKHLPVRCR